MNLEAEPTGYGQRIQLPDRDLRGIKVFGWVLIAIGSIGSLFMLGWIAAPAAIGIGFVFKGEWIGYVVFAFGMLGLSGLFMTIKLLAAGIAMVRNRFGCEVRITDKQVISREQFGWFSQSFKVDRSKIDSLFLRPLLIEELEGTDRPSNAQVEWITRLLPKNMHAIATQPEKGTLIAAGYPSEIVSPLAELIKDELDRNRVGLVSIVEPEIDFTDSSGGQKTQTIQQPVSIVQQTAEEAESVPAELPEDSSLEVSDQGDATVYRIPEQGTWKGSHGLMPFAVVWNTFLAIITFAMYAGNGNGNDGSEFWIMVAFLSVFWAVGIGLVVGGFYLGRQSALIGVRDGLLFIERKTIFGTKWTDFEPGMLSSIHRGASNMEVNDVPVTELKIQPVGKPAVGLFSQLSNDEIEWLAQQLSKQLDLRPESSNSWRRYLDPKNPTAAPEASQVSVDRSSGQTEITIPKQSMEGHWTLMLMGLGFVFGSIPAAIAGAVYLDFDWIVFPIAMIATVMGAVMLVVDRMYSTRWFHLIVNESQIRIERHGFLGERVGAISKEDLESVVLEDSGTKVNGRTYMHLSIESQNASETSTLMSGRDEREIAYVAALIHEAMGLSESD